MAKRLKKTAAKSTAKPVGQQGEVLAKQVMDSAQKIWLAGLGAFAKAQEEGGKVFEALVQQGQALEKKTRAMAGNAVGKAVESARTQAAESMSKATGTIDKLDQVFQDRVHRSLNKLGVLTARDIDDLTRQVTDLSESVRSLVASEKTARKAPAKRKPAAKKPAVSATVAKVTKQVTAAAKKTATTAAKRGMKQATKAVKTVKAAAAKLG
ncbi:MAG: phasin family protein [Betaproteobacteria bacterium]|nr:phasin family protein [Betaproteobacteria bacterium]